MQLINKSLLTLAALSAFAAVTRAHPGPKNLFPRMLPGDTVKEDGEVVRRAELVSGELMRRQDAKKTDDKAVPKPKNTKAKKDDVKKGTDAVKSGVDGKTGTHIPDGDNPTSNNVELRLPDKLGPFKPAPMAEGCAKANAVYAKMDHKAVPHTPNGIILTCMDSRVFPEAAFNMTTTEATTLVMRNAGGRAQDMVRSIVIAQQMLGAREIAIYHHTDCGLGAYDDEDIEKKVTENLGIEIEAWADQAWYTFKEDGLYQSLVSDVNYLKHHPLVNTTVISGWIYNVTDGLVQRVL